MDDVTPQPIDPRVDEILAIIARETAVDAATLRPEAVIQDLGIASIDMVQTLFALELHFDVEIPVLADRVGAEFGTVAELVSHVLATLNRARPAPGSAA